jgi:glycosyltransferase involved in cell wall biosynthesis
MAKQHATVVVPAFNEAPSLARLSERVGRVLDAADLDWDLVFVDDGSTDGSFAEIEKLHAADPRIKCLRFSRNFGSHIAISAGLEHASGDIAIVMTADLEEPPEAIPDFLEKWREGYHIVWGIRTQRNVRGLARIGSWAYHRIFAWLAEQGPGDSDIGGGFFLADTRVLEAVRRFPERNRSIIGLLLWAGFKQGRVTYKPASREFGRSKWSLRKKLRLALDTFVGFSNRVLLLMLGAGALSVALGLAAAAAAIALVVRDGSFGTASIAASLTAATLLVVGVQLASSGMLGEYVWRSLDESRRRPLYVLQDRLGLEDAVPPRDRPSRR